jgi:hypothetical protein
VAGRRQEYCEACRNTQTQTDKKIKCRTCEARCPEIMPENREVWQLWIYVNTQWRVSNGGIVGLDYTAVFAIAEVYGIELTPALCRKIKALEIHEIRRQGV